MEIKTFTTRANGMDFYCEMMGHGPTMVLVPDGSNDCGPYEKMMAYLADEFTVLTFDLGTVDMGQYFEEDFAQMAPVDFTIGTWTPSWLTAANQATAARGKRPVIWVNSAHSPHITMPKEMAEIVRARVKQYV